MNKKKRLTDAYRLPGFTPLQRVKGIFGDSKARIILLNRSKKKQCVQFVEQRTGVTTIVGSALCATFLLAIRAYTWNWRYAALDAGGAAG